MLWRERGEAKIEKIKISESLNNLFRRIKNRKTLEKAAKLIAIAGYPIIEGKKKLTLKVVASAGT